MRSHAMQMLIQAGIVNKVLPVKSTDTFRIAVAKVHNVFSHWFVALSLVLILTEYDFHFFHALI